jgi:exopolysaccharide biosynthesis operon protein EpsL
VRAIAVAVCAAAVASSVQPVAAQDLFTLRLGATATRDDNVFRLPESAPDPQLARGIQGKDDRVTSAYVGVGLDKAYSQQRFTLEATESATRYEKFSSLDTEAFNYRGEWQWRFTSRLSGTLSADRRESLALFNETGLDVQPNEVTVTNRRLGLVASLFAGWQLLGGAGESKRKNSRPFLAQPDTRESNVEAGVRYTAPSQTALTFMRRLRRGSSVRDSGDALTFGTGGFEVYETEVSVSWLVTGRSTLNGRLTRIDRHLVEAPQRDFSGTGVELSHRWNLTAKLSLLSSMQRTLTPFVVDTRASYRVDDTLAFAPTWQATTKLGFGVRGYRQETQFRGAVTPLSAPAREDVIHGVAATADWALHRILTLNASLRRERRASNEAPFNFEATIANVGAAVTW